MNNLIKVSLSFYLENINPNWISKSRIYGEAVENWVAENIKCDCLGSYIIQKANYKSVDGICENCQKQIQIKASKKIFKPNKNNFLKIMGAEYKTTLNSIKEIDWDLILVSYDEQKNIVQQVLKITSNNINEECVIPRAKLKETARRAGWQGCYLEFNWKYVGIIYNSLL